MLSSRGSISNSWAATTRRRCPNEVRAGRPAGMYRLSNDRTPSGDSTSERQSNRSSRVKTSVLETDPIAAVPMGVPALGFILGGTRYS